MTTGFLQAEVEGRSPSGGNSRTETGGQGNAGLWRLHSWSAEARPYTRGRDIQQEVGWTKVSREECPALILRWWLLWGSAPQRPGSARTEGTWALDPSRLRGRKAVARER